MKINRRSALRKTGQIALASVFGGNIVNVLADAAATSKAIAEFAGDATPAAGTITLTAPEIAENGNTVPISVSVESPMTEESYVESVMIVAEDNPNPEVATFHFTPASGVARASTRMRLAKTQNVIAVAKMNDGSVFTDTRNVKVTIGGCGG
ncbi:thiosulfate oxidation carrier protein SoxY [Chromatiales bacterium (ex Bugula neritina AB1)]|nr:thiosulfate oxidation carrier protein SoxY [Chromatiales bacterium (ex Bugula neritina AB1)]